MPFFQVIAAKNNQRVELIVQFATEWEARNNLHSQGYSIIEMQETTQIEGINSQTFFFDAYLDWKVKSWKIVSNDIFHAYRNLVDDLKYQIVAIYDSKEATEEEKMYITNKVKEWYRVYKTEKKQEIVSWEQGEIESDKWSNIFKKELQYYQGVLNKVIEKITRFLSLQWEFVSVEKKKNLETLLFQLQQIRSITNIDKLKQIGELALLKIGELEIQVAEKQNTLKRWEFLKETNALLKTLGSSQKVSIYHKSLAQRLGDFIKDLIVLFRIDEEKKENTSISKGFTYYKIRRDLAIYKEKLREVQWTLIKGIFLSRQEKNKLQLKKQLLEQNITLLEKRIMNRSFSYTKIIKGTKYYLEWFFLFLRFLSEVSLYSVFCIVWVFFFSYISQLTPFSYSYYPVSASLVYVTVYSILFHGVYSVSRLIFSGILFIGICVSVFVNF